MKSRGKNKLQRMSISKRNYYIFWVKLSETTKNTIKELPKPANRKQLQRFMGLANYCANKMDCTAFERLKKSNNGSSGDGNPSF